MEDILTNEELINHIYKIVMVEYNLNEYNLHEFYDKDITVHNINTSISSIKAQIGIEDDMFKYFIVDNDFKNQVVNLMLEYFRYLHFGYQGEFTTHYADDILRLSLRLVDIIKEVNYIEEEEPDVDNLDLYSPPTVS